MIQQYKYDDDKKRLMEFPVQTNFIENDRIIPKFDDLGRIKETLYLHN